MFILFLRYLKNIRVQQLKSAAARASEVASQSAVPISPLKAAN